jgi:transcription antitermination factor NusG
MPDSMKWFALRTSPQREFAVEQILTNHGLKAFCPTETKWKRIGPRKKRTQFSYAMLSRYIFVRCADPWSDILRQPWSRNVQGVVSLNGVPAVIPESAVARLAKLSGTSIPTSSVPVHRSFSPGETVRVARGAFQGRLVELESIKGRSGVVLAEMFGSKKKTMPVEIPLDDLEAA